MQKPALSITPILAVLTATQVVLAGAYNGAPGIIGPVAAPELGFAPQALGTYVGALSVASLLGGMFIDGVLRRYGGARTLQVALVSLAAGLLLAASGSVALMLLSSIAVGLGGGIVIPAALQLLSRVTPPGRLGLVLAINQCGIPMGLGLAGMVMPLLIALTSWRATLAVYAVLLLLITAVLQTMRDRLDVHRDPNARLAGRALYASMRLAWATPRLRLLGWMSFSYMTVQICLMAYLVSYVHLELGHSFAAAGAVLMASQIAAASVRLFLGVLLDRVGGHLAILGVLGLGAGLTALALGAARADWSYAAIVMIGALAGAFMMSWNAVFFAAVAHFAPPGRSGTAAGGTQIFTMVGATVGPLIFQAIVTWSGRYSTAFMVLSVFALPIALRLLMQRRDAP